MKASRWLNLVLVAGFLAACSANPNGAGPLSLFGTETPLPTAHAEITPAPDAQAAVKAFFEALKNNDYSSMYAMLSKASRDSITQEDFSKRYNDALNNMSASSLDFELISASPSPSTAEVAYRITYHTALIGDIQREILAHDREADKTEKEEEPVQCHIATFRI